MAEKPVQQVQGKSDRAQREEKVLNFWKENKIFEKTLEKEAPKGEFVFYDGPPFATGLPHYGHILPGTVKDVIPRYKTMRGFHVPRRWGWDCHGLPIENLVEKELGLETKKDIEKFGIGEFNKRAKDSVLTFEKDWKEIIPRTGRWVDMENAYKTMDVSYTQSVWWSFKNLYDKGLIYKGFKSMHICPRCETTLSNFEINQGYKDITDISVYAKFELVSEPGTYIVAWTTTPWTLPGNAALALKTGGTYIKAKKGGEILIVLKELADKVFKEDFEIVEELSAEKLSGEKYKMLFDYYQKEGNIYQADFVQAEEGTGIVHIAPAFGEEDYELSLKENIPFIQHVGTDGRFKSEVRDFAGISVKPKDDHQSTDVEIIKHLALKNLLFGKEKIIHSYPHCWRCDTPLLNYASSSWFLKVTEIKENLLANNNKVKWMPEDIRDGRFGKWLEGARDWAISRSRFWGTTLPVWENKDKSKMIVVDSMETLKGFVKKSGNQYFTLRHGEAGNNVTASWDFEGDPLNGLTEKGRKQIEEVAKEHKNFDIIVRSPILRAQETAEIFAKESGFAGEIVVDKRLTEFNPGSSYQGKPMAEFLSRYKHYPERYTAPNLEGENYTDVKRRVMSVIEEYEKKFQGKKILFVTHGAVVLNMVLGSKGVIANEIGDEIENAIYPLNGEVRQINFTPFPHNADFELDLHRPYIDEVVLEKDGEEYKRVPEVFDTWYDSGSVPFASRAATDFRPADFIAEGLDQTRGWFYTMIVLSTALFGASPYKQVVVNGLVLAEDGKKMSKRLNNYPELTYVLDKFGADALRYYFLSSPAVRAEDLAFSEKGLDEVMKKVLTRLENVVSFYELYQEQSTKGVQVTSTHILDEWVDELFAKLVREVTENLESYELDRASRPIADFVDDLSTWYLRRSRTRMEALPKLREVLLNLSKVLAPFMPFVAEEIYQRLKGEEAKESVHLENWPDLVQKVRPWEFWKGRTLGSDEVLEKMVETRRLVSLALEQRQKANIKVRQPLQKLEIRNPKLEKEYLEIIKDELNVKEVVQSSNLPEEVVLDTELTPELLEEGKMRDVIRAIQEWRKEKSLKPGESAKYDVPEADKEIFTKFSDEIKRATNTEF